MPGARYYAYSMTEHGWFGARPSGTETVYTLYAESFKGSGHLHRIQEQAQTAIQKVFRTGAAR
jgi:phosphoglucomutase